MPNLTALARRFNKHYDAAWEGEAHAQRGEFLRRFPADELPRLTLQRYAIGQNGRETYCYWLEPGTRKWAAIVGASANKFGVYHGKTKHDPAQRYRYSKRFSTGLPERGAERAAFRNVRSALVQLVAAGDALDFAALDANPLSQMFKAKTLSLYFPEQFVPICSAQNLQGLAKALGLQAQAPSQIQSEVMEYRRRHAPFSTWAPLKFAAFLYEQVLGHGPLQGGPAAGSKAARKPNPNRTVDFDKLMKRLQELGKESEAYALAQEKARLRSIGHPELAERIVDRTAQPGYGYDFDSFTAPRQPRCIEVKTFTAMGDGSSRFFLSANELAKARSAALHDHYFFYLVVYGADKKPAECLMRSAREVLRQAQMEPQTYLVALPHQRQP